MSEVGPIAEEPRPVIGGVVAVMLPCARCGYDLRGFPATGVCAECGARVSASVPDPVLMTGDDRRLESLEMGAMQAVVGAGLAAAGIAAFSLVLLSNDPIGSGLDVAVVALLGSGLLLVGVVLLMVAAWVICEVRVGDSPEGVNEETERVTRRVFVTGAILAVCVLAFQGFGVLAAAVLCVGLNWCMLGRIASLAKFIPDFRLVVWSWSLPVVQTAVAGVLVVAVLSRVGQEAAAASLGVVAAVMVAQAVVAERFRRGIRRVRQCVRACLEAPAGQLGV